MQPIEKRLVTAMDWQQEPIGKKLAIEFLEKLFMQLHWFICASSFFIFFLSATTPPQNVSLN